MNKTQNPHGTPDRDSWALGFIAAVVLLRLLWHLLHPVGMTGDETYYWLWGQYPALGYFSKPPLIGWLYGGLTALFGKSVWVYKATATLLGGGTLWYFHRTLQVLTGDRTLSRWGLVAMACLPATLLLSSILTIDAPLMFCWTGGMYFTARLLRPEKPATGDYLGLLFFLGLGYLSKQMMLVQLPLIIAMAALYRRERLRSIPFWLTLLGSLLALLPPVFWNATNHWITLEHTAHHFEPAPVEWGKSLERIGEFWGAMAALFSPVLFLLFFPALKHGCKHIKKQTVVFLVLFGAAGMVVMTAMAIRQRINPNWPAVFMPGTLGLIVYWAFNGEARKVWLKRGIVVAGALSLFLMLVLPLLDPFAESLSHVGIRPQRRGWQGYPQLVEQTMALAPEAEQLIFVGHRFTASQFAFHGDNPKHVRLWNDSERTRSQFDFFGEIEGGKRSLIVVERKKASSDGELPVELAEKLDQVTRLDELPMHPARDYPRFTIYLANTRLDQAQNP